MPGAVHTETHLSRHVKLPPIAGFNLLCKSQIPCDFLSVQTAKEPSTFNLEWLKRFAGQSERGPQLETKVTEIVPFWFNQ